MAAGVLYPTLAFLLLSSSRRLATFLRRWWWVSKFINWDRSQHFHTCMAVTTLIFALVHGIAHLTGDFVQAVGSTSSLLPNFPHPITYRALLRTRAGVTGIVAISVLIAICVTSAPWVRRKKFQLFQGIHLLIWPFIVLLLVHGTGRLIASPVLGYWLIVPVLAVLWDRIPRTINMFRPTRGCTLRVLEDSTVVLSIPKESVAWQYRPGQYVLLRVQEISFWQWHPFTVVGSTRDDFQSAGEVYVRAAGDWTAMLLARVKAGKTITVTLDGPFGSPSEQLSKYERVVVVGAGIGVTPYAGWLRDLPPRQRVDFHWVVRERVSFSWFSQLLNSIQLHSSSTAGPSSGSTDDSGGTVNIFTYATGLSSKGCLQHVCRVLLERHRTINHPSSFITGLECETKYGRPDIPALFRTARLNEVAAFTKIKNVQPASELNDETAEHGSKRQDGSVGMGDANKDTTDSREELSDIVGSPSAEGSDRKVKRDKVGVFFCGPNYLGMEISDRCRMETAASDTHWEFVGEVF